MTWQSRFLVLSVFICVNLWLETFVLGLFLISIFDHRFFSVIPASLKRESISYSWPFVIQLSILDSQFSALLYALFSPFGKGGRKGDSIFDSHFFPVIPAGRRRVSILFIGRFNSRTFHPRCLASPPVPGILTPDIQKRKRCFRLFPPPLPLFLAVCVLTRYS